MRVITNHDIPAATWRKLGTREELRRLALKHGIARGANGWNVARNLQSGYVHGGKVCTFRVVVIVNNQ